MFWEIQPSHNLLYGAGVRFIYDRYIGSVSFFWEGKGEFWIYYPSLHVLWAMVCSYTKRKLKRGRLNVQSN